MRLKGFATPSDYIWAGSIRQAQCRAAHTSFEKAGQDLALILGTVKCAMNGRGHSRASRDGYRCARPILRRYAAICVCRVGRAQRYPSFRHESGQGEHAPNLGKPAPMFVSPLQGTRNGG